jgi:hypothetical protein
MWLMKKTWVLALILALAASVAAGLLGLWPDLRSSGESTADRREKVRIANAVSRHLNEGWYVSGVRLNYLPHRALVEDKAYSTGRSECSVVAQDFGDRLDDRDWGLAPCAF